MWSKAFKGRSRSNSGQKSPGLTFVPRVASAVAPCLAEHVSAPRHQTGAAINNAVNRSQNLKLKSIHRSIYSNKFNQPSKLPIPKDSSSLTKQAPKRRKKPYTENKSIKNDHEKIARSFFCVVRRVKKDQKRQLRDKLIDFLKPASNQWTSCSKFDIMHRS